MKKVSLFLAIVMILVSLPFSSIAEPEESELIVAAYSSTELYLSSVSEDTGVTATFGNLTSASVDVMLILAAYDANGRMVFAMDYATTVAAGSTINHFFAVDVAANPGNTYTVFAWEPVTYAPLTAASETKPYAFEITGVDIINQRVAVVHLSNEVSTHFEQFALGRANYLTNFIKVDGEYLQDNKEVAVGTGARIYIRDDRKSFELVLGSSTGTYSGAVFKNEGGTIQFDFEGKKFVPYYHMHDDDNQEQSGDRWIRDVNDYVMTEDVFEYPAGTYGAAPTLAIEELRILDSRAAYVRLNQRAILTENNAGASMTNTVNFLNRMFVFGDLALTTSTSGASNRNAAYSYRLYDGHPLCTVGDGREFIIYYQGDLDAGATYTANWSGANLKGLINNASTSSLTATATAPSTLPASNFSLLKAELTESDSGKFEIELVFDRPFAFTRVADASIFRTTNTSGSAWCNKFYDLINTSAPDAMGNRNYYQALYETSTGMTGTVLTADDLKEILTFSGVKAGGVDFLDAFPGDAVLGHYKDSNTILINNNNRLAVTLDPGATVTIKANAIEGFGTRAAWGTTNVQYGNGANVAGLGTLTTRPNGPKNTQIGPVAISGNTQVVPYAEGYDPNWNKGTIVSESIVKFGHNDVYYHQYDGKKDPLVGGFDPRTRHSVTSSNTTVYAPDDRAFTGTLELPYVVQSVYPSYVIENKYVKATIVPEQAARFLYFIFKPTGHDAFYTNPAATNYNITNVGANLYPPTNIGGGTFVTGWLLVWGGTFPVFDGCEHGQIWTGGFESEVVSFDGGMKIVCKLKNDHNFQVQTGAGGYIPSSNNVLIGGNFVPFGPGMEYTVEYILADDSPVVDMSITVHNPANVAKTYEYYTCNTYAPGELSEWGHGSMKQIDANQIWQSQDVSFLYNVNNGESSNGKTMPDVRVWNAENLPAAQARTQLPQSIRDRLLTTIDNTSGSLDGGPPGVSGRIKRNNFYYVDTMRYLVNNHNMSTNFATDLNRLPQADWSGAVNLSNLEGVMRAGTDLMKATPGIKYWLWSYRSMWDTIPFERESGSSARPYLEPWPASGNQYFQNRAIDAGETHHWVESYYHSFGLDDATNATPDAMAQLKFYNEGGGQYRPAAEIYDTRLERSITAVLRRNDTNAVIGQLTYTSKIMAHEVIEATSTVPANTRVTLELYAGNTVAGAPFFTAWVVQGQAFEVDRTSPVQKVVISHKGSIDIPGRVAATGDVQYRVREVFAYNEPFSADGFMIAQWEKVAGDVDEVTITSGVNANTDLTDGTSWWTTNSDALTGQWWHSFDFITLRGHAPGSSVTLRATAKDENIPAGSKPYAELVVNVKKPLYLKIPYNAGNATGSITGQTLAASMYSPYKFNRDINLTLDIAKHDLDTVEGPFTLEIWDRGNERKTPFITFNNLVLGTNNNLLIPANTFPREEYYKLVVRNASGDALGYEYFRVDGVSDVDMLTRISASGDNLNVRFLKKNSNVANTLGLASGAKAIINGQEFTAISVGTTTGGTASNTNTIIITDGNNAIVAGSNTITIEGLTLPDYPGQTFTVVETYER